MPDIFTPRHADTISAAEGCGLDWRISQDEARSWSRMAKNLKHHLRECEPEHWRSQRARGATGNWLIGQTTESGGAIITFFPKASGATFRDNRHVENWGREIGYMASEAEGRLAIAAIETFKPTPETNDLHAMILAHGYAYRAIKTATKDVDFYERKVKGGCFELSLHDRHVNERGWIFGRSVTARFTPNKGPRWYNIGRFEALEIQELDGALPVCPVLSAGDVFTAMVLALILVSEARQAAHGQGAVKLRKPLASGEEQAFIAPLLAA